MIGSVVIGWLHPLFAIEWSSLVGSHISCYHQWMRQKYMGGRCYILTCCAYEIINSHKYIHIWWWLQDRKPTKKLFTNCRLKGFPHIYIFKHIREACQRSSFKAFFCWPVLIYMPPVNLKCLNVCYLIENSRSSIVSVILCEISYIFSYKLLLPSSVFSFFGPLIIFHIN